MAHDDFTIAVAAIDTEALASPPLAAPRRLPRSRPFSSPCRYDKETRNFAYWNAQFCIQLTNGLTIHELPTAPRIVLAVGEGADIWAVTAAQKWPGVRVHCMDLSHGTGGFARSLSALGIAGQVSFEPAIPLQALSYPDDYFDLVVVRYIGLHISERDYPDGLGNLLRMCKPDGVVECMEDDLWFPGAAVSLPPPTYAPSSHSRNRATSSPRPPLSFYSPASAYTYTNGGGGGPTSPFDARSSSHDHLLSPISEPSSSPIHSRTRLNSQASSYFPPPPSPSLSPATEEEVAENPLDHTRLAKAWEEMLAARGIPMAPTSVIPLYLSVTTIDYRILPVLHVQMPGKAPLSSAAAAGLDRSPEEERADVETYQKKIRRKAAVAGAGKRASTSRARNGDVDVDNPAPPRRRYPAESENDGESEDDSDKNSSTTIAGRLLAARAPMHLARTVQIVRSCKEAIWEAYEVLYSHTVFRGAKMAQGEIAKTEVRLVGTRDRFEQDWHNWETDMTARIGPRDVIAARIGWQEPAEPVQYELPAWRTWREQLWVQDPATGKPAHTTAPIDEVCRSMRAFVLYKSKP